jgi:hypothetical protein
MFNRYSQFSAQRRRIIAFATGWAKAKMGPGYHAHGGMRRGILTHVVSDYAINWLAQHGEMPTGVHTARATRGMHGMHTQFPVLEVDFTPLHRLASSGKSRQQPLAEDPSQGSPAAP